MKRSIQPLATDEAMVSPRQAAELLPLPRYWFTSPQLRARYRMPHYPYSVTSKLIQRICLTRQIPTWRMVLPKPSLAITAKIGATARSGVSGWCGPAFAGILTVSCMCRNWFG
jgi:hypothetical protein